MESTDELIEKSVDIALETGYVKKGDVIVKELDSKYVELLDRVSGVITEQESVSSDITIMCMMKKYH